MAPLIIPLPVLILIGCLSLGLVGLIAYPLFLRQRRHVRKVVLARLQEGTTGSLAIRRDILVLHILGAYHDISEVAVHREVDYLVKQGRLTNSHNLISISNV
jgi:hypothetical protein